MSVTPNLLCVNMLHVNTPIRLPCLPATTRTHAGGSGAARKSQRPAQPRKPGPRLATHGGTPRTGFPAAQTPALTAAHARLLGLPENGPSPRLLLPREPALHPGVVETAPAQLAQPLQQCLLCGPRPPALELAAQPLVACGRQTGHHRTHPAWLPTGGVCWWSMAPRSQPRTPMTTSRNGPARLPKTRLRLSAH